MSSQIGAAISMQLGLWLLLVQRHIMHHGWNPLWCFDDELGGWYRPWDRNRA